MSSSDSAIVPTQKQQIAIGNRGITPSDMDGLWRFATAVSKSGLAPRGIETPEAIFVALEMGLEVGLPMMAALQNIAVVNGRPTLWGDAQLAVVRGTGELEVIEEWFESDGKRLPRNPSDFTDSTTAVCRVQRRGFAAAETGFSVADAKRANLWGKQGPWSQYPQRMLRARARSFALRDQFGDALRGLRSTEEAVDDTVASAVNVTPAPIFKAQPKPEPAPVVVETSVDPAPAPEAAPATEQTPQQQLADLIVGAGLTFDQVHKWAVDSGYKIQDAGSFDEIPTATATRFLKNGEKVIAAVRFASQLGAENLARAAV